MVEEVGCLGLAPARSQVVEEPPLLPSVLDINPVPSCMRVLRFVSKGLVPGTLVPECPHPRPTQHPVLGAES